MARLKSDLYVTKHLVAIYALTDNIADDVPRAHLRPPTSGWQGSGTVPCQDQRVRARPFKNAVGIGVEEWNYSEGRLLELGRSNKD